MAQATDVAQITTPSGEVVARIRKRRPQEWTDQDQADFLVHLAATANVSASARAVGKSQSGTYVRRGRSLAFRRAWDAALAEGYARLEAMLLGRALNGKRTVETIAGKEVERVEYSDMLALNLLRQHQRVVAEQRAAAGPAREEPKVVRARLAKLINALVAKMPDRPTPLIEHAPQPPAAEVAP